MKAFRRFATRWPVSAFCIAALILPITGTILTPISAYAQAGTIEIAIVDFRNSSKTPNDMFGSMATDAVAVEMLRSGKFSVTSSDALRSKMEELGYRTKDDRTLKLSLTPSMMMRLGQEVGAACVVIGELASVRIENDKRKAEARVAVRMLDVSSGEWVNGAIATGTSNPRIGYTADKENDWIIEAINNAAHSAVDTMVRYIIPEATIIGTIGTSDVLLNKGSQEGIAPGMEMIVIRRGDTGQDEVVGRIKVTKITDTDARASITRSTRGVKPEDRVRAVYELPSDADGKGTVSPRSGNEKRMAKGSKLLFSVLALLALGAIFAGGGDKPEEVPGAVVMAGATPDIPSEFGDSAIFVAWNNPKSVRYSDIIEYHIWRDNRGQYAGTGGTGNIGPIAVPDQTTAFFGGTTAAGSYDHSFIDDIAVRDLTYRYADENHGLASSDLDAMPGITIGKAHSYWVSCLYRRQPASEGDVTYWETTPVYAGRATALLRPEQVNPGNLEGSDYADLSNITFEWRGSRKANEYVIEVCPYPDFRRNSTWAGHKYRETSQEGQLISETFDISTSPELIGVLPGSTLYWRVGARNSLDSPGPYPAGPSPSASGSKSTRYIYSEYAYTFQTLGDVPPLPE